MNKSVRLQEIADDEVPTLISLPPAHVLTYLKYCQNLAVEYARRDFKLFIEDLIHTFSEVCTRVGSCEKLRDYSVLLQLLYSNSEEFERYYCGYIAEGFVKFKKRQLHTTVEIFDVTEQHTISALSKGARRYHTEPLRALNQRFALVSGVQEISDAQNPASPIQLCESLRRALHFFPMSNEAKVLAYQAYDKRLLDLSGQIIEELNQYLKYQGILPLLSHYLPSSQACASHYCPPVERRDKLSNIDLVSMSMPVKNKQEVVATVLPEVSFEKITSRDAEQEVILDTLLNISSDEMEQELMLDTSPNISSDEMEQELILDTSPNISSAEIEQELMLDTSPNISLDEIEQELMLDTSPNISSDEIEQELMLDTSSNISSDEIEQELMLDTSPDISSDEIEQELMLDTSPNISLDEIEQELMLDTSPNISSDEIEQELMLDTSPNISSDEMEQELMLDISSNISSDEMEQELMLDTSPDISSDEIEQELMLDTSPNISSDEIEQDLMLDTLPNTSSDEIEQDLMLDTSPNTSSDEIEQDLMFPTFKNIVTEIILEKNTEANPEAEAPSEPTNNNIGTSDESRISECLKMIEFGTWFEFEEDKHLKITSYDAPMKQYLMVDKMCGSKSMISDIALARKMINREAKMLSGSAKPFIERTLRNITHRRLAKAQSL